MSQAKKIICNGLVAALAMLWSRRLATKMLADHHNKDLVKLVAPLCTRIRGALAPFEVAVALPPPEELFCLVTQAMGLAAAGLMSDTDMEEIAAMEDALAPQIAEALR